MNARAGRATLTVGLVLAAVLGFGLSASGPVPRAGGGTDRSLAAAIDDFRPEEIVSVLPHDAIQALTNPRLVRAEEATLTPDDFVIGVELGGQARAYLVKLLSEHEVVNDEIDGQPFAVTWCPLCHTAIVYDRRLGDRTLTFGVSGKLYRNSLIMYDRETGTLWTHFLGAAVQGSLEGAQLTSIPSTFTTWAEWRGRWPATLVLDVNRAGYPKRGVLLDGEDSYDPDYESSQAGILGAGRHDDRLPPKELVLGVLRPAVKAYALRDVERLGRIRDALAGEPVEIVWNPASRTASAFRLGGGRRERLLATPVFWFAWVAFFSGAPLWESEDRSQRTRPSDQGSPERSASYMPPPLPVQ